MLLLNAQTWIAQTPPLTGAIVCGVGAGGTFARVTEVASIRCRSAQSMCCSHSAPAHLGGGEVLGSVACEFRPGEQQLLLVSAPGDLYPLPSLSLIYYIITLDSKKTKQEGRAGPLQLHYLVDFRHLSRRQVHPWSPPVVPARRTRGITSSQPDIRRLLLCPKLIRPNRRPRRQAVIRLASVTPRSAMETICRPPAAAEIKEIARMRADRMSDGAITVAKRLDRVASWGPEFKQ
jgi:hypothetical protein